MHADCPSHQLELEETMHALIAPLIRWSSRRRCMLRLDASSLRKGAKAIACSERSID